MSTLAVSPDYQIKVPEHMLRALDLEPGHKLDAIVSKGVIHLIPCRPIREMKGFLPGIDSTVERDPDRV